MHFTFFPRVATAVLLVTTLARSLSAATLHVPANHATVRDAVDAAAHGDTVLVAPGVHAGGVFIDGKAITIASWYLVSGDTALVSQTILSGDTGNPCSGGGHDCAGNAVLEFGASANGSAVVGLTITNGENGIGSGSTVDITRCRIIANGDGVDYVPGSGGTFRNSLFAGNGDDGIDLNGRMNLIIADNDIRDNRDDGIEFRLYSHVGATQEVDIVGNRISGNGEDGVQIIDYPSVDSYVIRVERNLFRSNFDGSGLSAAIACMPNGETIESLAGAPAAEPIHVTNNTFIGEKNGVVGGANLVALNNIFTDTEGTAILRVGGGSVASYNLFWNNGTNHAESNLDPPHLLYTSPLIDETGRLTPASPAIDAGTSTFEWQGQTVLSMSGSDYVGSAPDLGAFEAANTAPLVSAGPDQAVTLTEDAVELGRSDILGPPPGPTLRADAELHGTFNDDGLPYPPAPSTTWSVVSGPGPVRLASLWMPDTRATFFTPGTYVLRLTVNDGQLSASDLVEVTVELTDEPPVNPVVERRVGAGSDDAEESDSGTFVRDASDLDLVYDSGSQTVGLRFTDIAVPPGATIIRAHIQFTADSTQSQDTSLLLQGQAADDPTTFTNADRTVSDRPRTAASATWSPPPWTVVGEAGPDQRTSDLAGVIQEIVDRPGWASGNAIAIIITGTGERTARSQELDPAGAALLQIEYGELDQGIHTAVGEAKAPLEVRLHGVDPQPSRGALRVDFTLAGGGPAVLELVDVAGRRVIARDLTALGAGRHAVELRDRLPVGVYLVRLTQAGRARVGKAIVLR